MKWNNVVRSTVAGGASLALALGLTACSRDYTVAYVYTISASTGGVSAYAVDYETGILNQINGSPFTTGFTNPTTVIAAPNNKYIYVVGGSQNAQVEEFAVGTDGKLYGEHTYDLTGTEAPNTGSFPLKVGAAIDTTGTFLYVTYNYQSGYSSAAPGPGGVSIYQINQTDGSLNTPINLNVGNNPVGIAVSAPVCVTAATALIPSNPSCTGVTGGGSGIENTYVYVVDQELAAVKPTVLGYAQNMTTGALTPLSGTTFNTTLNTYQGYAAGVVPSAIAVDGTSRFVYVTDQNQNEIIGYSIDRTATGNLTPLSGSPFGTGQFPLGLTIDPRSEYVYTSNFSAGSVSSFAISQSTGNLTTVAGTTLTTGTGPSCVVVEPALGKFLFTSSYIGNEISAATLNANTGALTAVQDTPFPTAAEPACAATVANGAHSTFVPTP